MMLIVIKLWLYHIIFTRGRLCTPISPTQKWLYFISDLKNVINVLQQQNGWANRTLSSMCVLISMYTVILTFIFVPITTTKRFIRDDKVSVI